MAERKVTIRSGGETPPATPAVLSEADQAAAVRKQVYKAAAGGVTATVGEGQVEIELKSGSHVILGRPNQSTLLVISRIMREEPDNEMLFQIVKALTYVRSIDGTPVNIPQNMVEVKDTLNQLGPGGDEEVFLAYSVYWPPVTTADLKVIQKKIST